jgi:predicted outer membrane lipoprotein
VSHWEEVDASGAPKEPTLERSLLASIVAEPGCLPELLADFAVRRTGPAVPERVGRLRQDHPHATAEELREQVMARGRRAVVSEGSFVGGPFVVLIPVAFCAALLRQARTVLELAALDGRDPTARDRAGELLVLQGVYEDTGQAQDALARLPRAGGLPARGRRWKTLWGVTLRMARLLGVLTPGDAGQEAGGRLRGLAVQVWRWSFLGAVFLVGLVAPLVWLPYMAMAYRRGDAQLMQRVVAYYFGDTAPSPRRRFSRPQPEVVAAALRALLSLLVPIGMIAVTLLAGLHIADSHWPVFGIALATASAVVGALWYERRRRRRRQASHV